jgi:hypothetical protein
MVKVMVSMRVSIGITRGSLYNSESTKDRQLYVMNSKEQNYVERVILADSQESKRERETPAFTPKGGGS